jgi:hypothetical protein
MRGLGLRKEHELTMKKNYLKVGNRCTDIVHSVVVIAMATTALTALTALAVSQ